MGLDSLTNGYHDHGASQEPSLLRNNQSKPWVIQKFGGTSIGKFANKIAEDIVRLVLCYLCSRDWLIGCCRPSIGEHRIAVVCSARSSHSKGEGTTNRRVIRFLGVCISC